MEAVALGDLDGAADLVGGPLARAPVQRLARRDDVAHRPDRLLERGVGIGAVAVQDVDEVDPHPLQRPVDGVQQVLAVERVAHVRGVVDAPEDLRRQHVGPPRPAELGEHAAHDRLALATGVGLGVVEEVAPGVVGRLHALHRQVVLHLGVERHPRSERQHRDLQAGASEPAVLHAGSSCVMDRTIRPLQGGHRGRREPALHALDPVDERRQQAGRLARDLEVGQPLEDLLEHHRDLPPGEVGAEAEVRAAGAVADLGLGVRAGDVEARGRRRRRARRGWPTSTT